MSSSCTFLFDHALLGFFNIYLSNITNKTSKKKIRSQDEESDDDDDDPIYLQATCDYYATVKRDLTYLEGDVIVPVIEQPRELARSGWILATNLRTGQVFTIFKHSLGIGCVPFFECTINLSELLFSRGHPYKPEMSMKVILQVGKVRKMRLMNALTSWLLRTVRLRRNLHAICP